MSTIIFLDYIQSNTIGGYTNDKRKVEYALSLFGLTFNEVLAKCSKDTKFPTFMFGVGQYVFLLNISFDLTITKMGLIHYSVDIEKNFDSFADFLEPKIIRDFYNFSNILKDKKDKKTILLSDNELQFEVSFQNYMDFLNHQ